ncbi:hypothetical protein TcCL_ESM09852 [Trypanosoma cruzi]|nr:hypothetical protein TcCL_ESM09852 [Trypanosoma cruzi]
MGKRRHQSRFREMPLLMNYTASVTLLGHPANTFALPSYSTSNYSLRHCDLQQSEILSATLFQDTSDDVRRTAFDSIYSSLGDYDFELWMDSSSYLAESASGRAALLYDSTTANDAPVEVHRAAAGRLACSYRAECLAIENVFGLFIPPCLEISQSPTRMLEETDSLSAIEALRCPPTVRDRVTE